jgi:nucleolar GTP-binding protein
LFTCFFTELNDDLNPFSNLKYCPDDKMLLDIAFSKAAKLALLKSKKPIHIRTREREAEKIKKVKEILTSRLETIVKQFPNFDEIHPFYRTLADTVVSLDELRQALASVNSSIRIINKIAGDSKRRLSLIKTASEARQIRIAAYGRISSVIHRLKSRLELIQIATKEYRRFPSVDLKLPVIVVAGFPNVGKSSFVAFVSSANPEIAEYPFTTKKVSLGHFSLDSFKGQILDIPGLLDRAMSERNPIERRAIAAIQYLADAIIFLIDPTLTCGYNLDNQISLIREMKNEFPNLDISLMLNKCDIASEEEKTRANNLLKIGMIPLISTLTGEGVEQNFREALFQSKKVQEKLKSLQDQLRQL